MALNLSSGVRAERKLLLTVAEWGTGTSPSRELLGTRTEDSSIEFNPDIETMTDILGITYTDVNKTEPQQSFDPYTILGGSELADYLTEAALTNNISAYNGQFNIYLIAAYKGTSGSYYAVKHTGCSIIPQSIGGDTFVNMPIEVHLSNQITEGTVSSLDSSFTFTETT